MTNSLFWNRFKRNKLSLVGFFIISASIILALLGYLITPDSTPYSNNQILSIAAKPPLFKVKIASIRINQTFKPESFLHILLFGKETHFISIPIDSFRFEGDFLILHEYSSGLGDLPFISKYHLADVVFPVQNIKSIVSLGDNTYFFKGMDRKQVHVKRADLIHEILKNQISEKTYLLGTDRFGRDMLSRLIIGTRVSISVGFISVFISLLIGI